MTQFIGRSLYLGKGNTSYSQEVLQECQDCGALVRHDGIEKHKKFHDTMNAVMEEEQSIERERRPLLGPNPGLMK